MKKEIILSLNGLSKHFGGVKVIEDITLDVIAGERVGLIGPNGAGKSTLFNMIAGDIVPSGGTIYYFGNRMNQMPNYKRTENGIVRTFQQNNLMIGLTVKENLLLVFQRIDKSHTHWWKSVNKRNYSLLFEKVENLLYEWNLLEYSHTKVQDLAYGVQRQVEMIMAIAGNPKLLLLDEPTAGMSQVETDQIISLINKLPSNVTIMMIEHDIEVLFGNMQRVIVLDAGTLIADGTPEAVRENPDVKEIYMGKEAAANA